MKNNILVLGAGHVGSAIAIDLKKTGHHVTSLDSDPRALEKISSHGIQGLQADFTDSKALQSILK
jgi:Trk K+ transport system NAD-binding subunit